mmetsp:Transcript_3772/g.12027  ORF Transcript_3772/g.12027 Transcript_3772/m.12027 type:complete len:243 (-) Transcript_3772:38-766(-)
MPESRQALPAAPRRVLHLRRRRGGLSRLAASACRRSAPKAMTPTDQLQPTGSSEPRALQRTGESDDSRGPGNHPETQASTSPPSASPSPPPSALAPPPSPSPSPPSPGGEGPAAEGPPSSASSIFRFLRAGSSEPAPSCAGAAGSASAAASGAASIGASSAAPPPPVPPSARMRAIAVSTDAFTNFLCARREPSAPGSSSVSSIRSTTLTEMVSQSSRRSSRSIAAFTDSSVSPAGQFSDPI